MARLGGQVEGAGVGVVVVYVRTYVAEGAGAVPYSPRAGSAGRDGCEGRGRDTCRGDKWSRIDLSEALSVSHVLISLLLLLCSSCCLRDRERDGEGWEVGG